MYVYIILRLVILEYIIIVKNSLSNLILRVNNIIIILLIILYYIIIILLYYYIINIIVQGLYTIVSHLQCSCIIMQRINSNVLLRKGCNIASIVTQFSQFC